MTRRDGPLGRRPRLRGVATGTVPVATLLWVAPGTAWAAAPDDSIPHELTRVGTTLFFAATDPVAGMELWKSDGTKAGTVRVKDINPGP